MSKTEEAVLNLAKPIADAAGVEIYDVEYKKEGTNWFVRVYIEGEKPITLDDCEAVSRPLSDALDEAEIIDTAYYLEVSSPGIERVLSKDSHFQKAIGEKVEVKLFAVLDGKKKFTGTLKDFKDGMVYFTDEETQKEYEIEKNKASQIKTLFSFE